jgi:N-acyl-D-amino-acid deacylase
MAFDVIFAGGTIVDGSGGAALRGDVGIVADRIFAVGDLAQADAKETIDCSGLTVSAKAVGRSREQERVVFFGPSNTSRNSYSTLKEHEDVKIHRL